MPVTHAAITASGDHILRRRGIDNERPYEHLKVSGERVDAVVREDVALLKMDVEGFEFHALEVCFAIRLLCSSFCSYR